MSVEKRIEALVIAWLAKYHGIEAVTARIDEDDWEMRTETGAGCDTCAWSTEFMELTIWYTNESGYSSYVEERKDPLNFLAELLKLEDENK
ncbi:hypothetical protein ABZ916_25595 [Streptomyces sp. NPDC046853]|uniref:hypothetical protein n=1 Tax=Streptomyces sp. NPDC046853 TaxID=3154920 RepID=UPI0033C3BF22